MNKETGCSIITVKKRQENKQCEKVEICASEEREGKKGLFFAYRSFPSGIRKSLWPLTQHIIQMKKSERKR